VGDYREFMVDLPKDIGQHDDQCSQDTIEEVLRQQQSSVLADQDSCKDRKPQEKYGIFVQEGQSETDANSGPIPWILPVDEPEQEEEQQRPEEEFEDHGHEEGRATEHSRGDEKAQTSRENGKQSAAKLPDRQGDQQQDGSSCQRRK